MLKKITYGIKFLSIASLFLGGKLRAEFDQQIYSDLREAIVTDKTYFGTKSFESSSKGTLCEKHQNVRLDWVFNLEDVRMKFLEDGAIQLNFSFKDNTLNTHLNRRGGLICQETYTSGVVMMSEVGIQLKFYPATDEGSKPRFHFDSLMIDGLAVVDVHQTGPWNFSMVGNLPYEMNSWLENNINVMINLFLQTSIAQRITDYYTDKIIDKIGNGGLGPL
jgi:hypothetical protein